VESRIAVVTRREGRAEDDGGRRRRKKEGRGRKSVMR
jgi:hypothetical protein